ncbi:MAG: hypothetical protein WCH86_03430, partial [Kiritimatiellales bacterium]
MRKLIKLAAVAALTASVACFSSAATIMDTGFRTSDTPAYSDGNLAGQNGWADVTNSIGANAFNVNDSSVTGFASTVGITLSTNVGNTVYYTNSFLNAVNEELSGSLDFIISSTYEGINGGDVFRLGISTTVTNNLSGASNQVYLAVNSTAAGIIKIQSKEGTNATITLCQLSALQSGWSATEVPLPVSDTLRLTWKIRKTVAGDTYMLSASLTNLVADSTNSVGHAAIMRADAYASTATYFMMMHSAGSLSSNNTGYSDISIDNLSITNESEVAPVLYPSTVYSDSGSSQVILNWNLAAEATGCYIERSWNGTNGYSTIASDLPGTTITYTDTTVTNGESYYYRVTWTALGASPVSFGDVLGEPNAAKTGLIFDSSFRSTDSPAYASGDLAGQNKWKSIAASGAPAFYVDSTGNGFAETAPYSNYFDNVNGNQVYYNQTMSNGVGAAWSGTTVFTLSATPELEETQIKTNSVDGTVTTNTQRIAFMPGGRVFEFGLTSDPSAVLNPNDKKSTMLITVRSTTSSGVLVLLNGYNATVNLMFEVPRANLGWDPEWGTTNAAPDFETDPITLNWQIRKTASNLVYAGAVSLNVGTNSYTGSVQFTDEVTTQPVNLYTNPVARFAMSHSFQSQTSSTSTMVNVSIDSLSLSHTNTAPIMNAAPFALSGVVGNTNILLSWQGAIEASSFDVYRSVGFSNANYVLKGSVTNLWSYNDTNLTDLVLYNYKVVAKYATTGASNTSDSVSIRARGKVDVLKWDAVGKVAVNQNISQTNKVVVTNGSGGVVCNIYGNYTNGAIVGAGLGDYSGVPVYGVYQITGSLAVATIRMEATKFTEESSNKGITASNRVSALMYIPATNGPVDMTSSVYAYDLVNDNAASAPYRAAFRDSVSGKWYVSDNSNVTNGPPSNVQTISIADMAGSTNRWRELTITQDNLMCGTNNPVTTPSFASVDAIGFMMERSPNNIKITSLKLSTISPLPTCAITTTTNDIHPGVY